MNFELLEQFVLRIKSLSPAFILYENLGQNTKWQNYGFANKMEALNLVLMVMLFIMHRTLIEESCTIDDITQYIDNVNTKYFKKSLSLANCNDIAKIIMSTCLANEGNQMFFTGFDTNPEINSFVNIPVAFIKNEIKDINNVRKVNYTLLDEGIAFLLRTKEIEQNLVISIHSMIIGLHIRNKDYRKAYEAIADLFMNLTSQARKIETCINSIRNNVRNFDPNLYEEIQLGTISQIQEIRAQLEEYEHSTRDIIKNIQRLYHDNSEISAEHQEQLKYLEKTLKYLNRSLDEFQKIMIASNKLQSVYDEELRSQLRLEPKIKFNFRTEIFEKILESPNKINCLTDIFSPLFLNSFNKSVNLSTLLKPREQPTQGTESEPVVIDTFDVELIKQQELEAAKKKHKKITTCIKQILGLAMGKPFVTLAQIRDSFFPEGNTNSSIISSRYFLMEILAGISSFGTTNIDVLKKEIHYDDPFDCSIPGIVLNVITQIPEFNNIKEISIEPLHDQEKVVFPLLPSQHGETSTQRVICEDFKFSLIIKE